MSIQFKPTFKNPLVFFEKRSNNEYLSILKEDFALKVEPNMYTNLELSSKIDFSVKITPVDDNLIESFEKAFNDSDSKYKNNEFNADNNDFLYYLRAELSIEVEKIKDIIIQKYRDSIDTDSKGFKDFLRFDIIEQIKLIYKNNCHFLNENQLYVSSLNEILKFVKYTYSDFVNSEISLLEIEQNTEVDYSILSLPERIDLVFKFATSKKLPTEVDFILSIEEYEDFKYNLIQFLKGNEVNSAQKILFKGIEITPLNYLFYIIKNINGVRKLTADQFYDFVEKVVANYNISNRDTFKLRMKYKFDIEKYRNVLPKFVVNFYIKNL